MITDPVDQHETGTNAQEIAGDIYGANLSDPNSAKQPDENTAVSSKNPTGTEAMCVDDSVESEMEKMHDSSDSDMNNSVNLNNKSNDKGNIASEMDMSFEDLSKFPEVVNNPNETQEQVQVDDNNRTNHEPFSGSDQKSQNVFQPTEADSRPATEQAQSSEIDLRCSEDYNEEFFEKPQQNKSTKETEHINLPTVGQTTEKNAKGEAMKSSSDVPESNPLGENTESDITGEPSQMNESYQDDKDSESSSHPGTKSIEALFSSQSSLSLGDFMSTDNSNKEDDLNKTSASDITMDSVTTDSQEGEDAELCIIPDTQREISQVTINCHISLHTGIYIILGLTVRKCFPF